MEDWTDGGMVSALIAAALEPPRIEALDPGILLVRYRLPWLRDLVSEADHLDAWKRSTVGNGGNGAVNEIRTSDQIWLFHEAHPELAAYESLVETVVADSIVHYRNHNPYAIEGWPRQTTRDLGYDLLRYRVGQRYGVHVDSSPGAEGRVGEREVSLVLYPHADFEGGTLRFPRQGIEVRPEPGLLVMFPASWTYPHESKPVTLGTKHAVVTWLATALP